MEKQQRSAIRNYRRCLSVTVICTIAAVLMVLSPQILFAQAFTYYVSSDGNDKTEDGPFKTIDRSIRKIGEITRDNNSVQAITVIIREGNYPVKETLHLNWKQSPGRNCTITFKNYPNEKVRLNGGTEITGFRHLTDKKLLDRVQLPYRDSIYQIDLRALGINDFGHITNRGCPGMELFFNQQKMTPARWPNEGWALIADVPQTGELVYKGELPHMRFDLPVGKHYGRFTYAGDQPNNWSDIAGISLHGYWVWNWFDEYLAIKSIDTSLKEITIAGPHSQYGYCKEQRYYAANVLEELDRAGEWYIDRKTGVLLFWPPAPITNAKVLLSLLEGPLMQLDSANNVHIEGITFSSGRGNGIVINGGSFNTIAGCSFTNLGDVAVLIAGGNHNGIRSSDISNVALGGILLQGGDRKTLQAANNYVTNCHIHDYSEWLRTYQSGITVAGVGNHMAHNVIHNAPGSGIQLTGNEHIIEFNELHHLALETGDVGAFYMGRDWTERGNSIRYNYFHDLMGPGNHDVNAVYLDDWASGSRVTGNIFSACARGIMIGGGRDNTILNNIFLDCKIAIHVDARGLGWAKYYFDGTDSTLFKRMDAMNFSQPPYSRKYPALPRIYADEPAVAKYNLVSNNIAYHGKWIDLHNGLTFSVVQSENNLVGSPAEGPFSKKDRIVKGNPGITDPLHNDFRITTKGQKFGFKNIPYEKIGMQADAFRKDPPKSLPHKQ